ncbi:LOW QUALITY PROTEIN: uncharacterized protein EMH_0060970 [Eimeria mitis]|uniref:Uncharacterized protein n=1 Tax=Eimeria mitis TaxID=44415 RepID=U6JZ67_9EIME|nr:LOW QUALITY PROTEIN: uncharacterized protein EMH_0060970 [Eimeria mitis]CDJ30734.1 hypothetical protein, conserved [Eimeria mitis]
MTRARTSRRWFNACWKAGELTGPLAAAVARRLSTAFRAAARRGASPLLMGEGGPSLERALTTETGEVDFRVHFGDGATVLLAMKEAGLFEDTCAGAAARELQEATRAVDCNKAVFEENAEDVKAGLRGRRRQRDRRYLRKMQKTSRRVFEEGDASEIVALAWPLACVSAAVKIPAPQISEDNGGRGSLDCFTSKYDDMKMLHRDRDVVLRLAKAQIHRAVCSRLPCTPFDLALGFAGLERLGQKSCAEYVLTAFSTTAAGASCEELCRLGRDIMLAGIRQKALWEAFADAVQTAAEQRRQTPPSQEHNSNSQRIEAELAQWLRFCGRIV